MLTLSLGGRTELPPASASTLALPGEEALSFSFAQVEDIVSGRLCFSPTNLIPGPRIQLPPQPWAQPGIHFLQSPKSTRSELLSLTVFSGQGNSEASRLQVEVALRGGHMQSPLGDSRPPARPGDFPSVLLCGLAKLLS